MNAPFYHPDEIDWQDGLNPLAMPRFRQQRSPYNYRTLQGETFVSMRNAPGYHMLLRVVPEAQYQSIGPNATFEHVLQFAPGTWVYGLSASSAQPEGIRIQITQPNGAQFFAHAPITSAQIAGARPYFLPKPQGIVSPDLLTVRIINLSAAANIAQVVLWTAEPPQ